MINAQIAPMRPDPGAAPAEANGMPPPRSLAAPGERPGIDWATLVRDLDEEGARCDRSGSFPSGNIALLRDAGLLALTVPQSLGGQGEGLVRSVEAIGLVAQGCPSTALILAMQCAKQAALARGANYPPALRERVGRDAVRDGALINAIRVEPELGSPTRGGLPATIARRVPDGWRITGRKIYCTGAPGLAWFETFCRTDEPAPRIGPFLVPAGAPGLRIEETWDHLGLRASGSHDVVLEDVFVPAAHAGTLVVPGEGPPPREDAQAAWNAAMLGALYGGVAIAARDWIVRFAHDRKPANLGATLATLPRVQEVIGEIEALIVAGRRIVGAIAVATDAGYPPPAAEAGALKVVLTRNAVEAVRLAVSLAGNHALSRGNPLERRWRDIQCGLVHAPQTDAGLITAGRAALARTRIPSSNEADPR